MKKSKMKEKLEDLYWGNQSIQAALDVASNVVKASQEADRINKLEEKWAEIDAKLDHITGLLVDARYADKTVYSIESRLNTLIWDFKDMATKRTRKKKSETQQADPLEKCGDDAR